MMRVVDGTTGNSAWFDTTLTPIQKRILIQYKTIEKKQPSCLRLLFSLLWYSMIPRLPLKIFWKSPMNFYKLNWSLPFSGVRFIWTSCSIIVFVMFSIFRTAADSVDTQRFSYLMQRIHIRYLSAGRIYDTWLKILQQTV